MARVLVVEDQKIAAQTTAEIVWSAGHTVVGVVDSGESALAAAERFDTELALVDIGIRGALDGVELAERLRAERDVAVLFVTGHSEQSVIERAKRALPYGFVLKPFDSRALGASIEVALARREIDREVRKHGRWLSLLLESLGVGVIAADAGGIVRFATPLAQRLCWDEPLGKLARESFPLIQATTEASVDPVSDVLRNRSSVELPSSTLLVRPDGQRVPLEGGAALAEDTGGGTHVVLAFRDISERLESERQRQRTDRLEALATMSAGIAHDFNNLLAIMSNTAALGAHLAGHDTRTRSLFDDIQSSTVRASTLTSQLMAFAKGGNSTPTIQALEPVLRSSISLALRGAATRCELRIAAGLWPVRIDEAQIAQVFTNLALNARDAMGGAGTLRVRAENRHIAPGADEELSPGDYVKVSVSDRGVGIPQDVLEHVFEPYFTTKALGHGLGLASSFGIVRRHAGTLRVKSRLGRGTTFSVHLPATRDGTPKVDAAPLQAPCPTPAARARILVMDDEEHLRDVLCDCLVELGYDAESAANGDAAIERFESAQGEGRPFDLLILDLTVHGGKGGVETLEALRKMQSNVRAVATSGYSDSNVMEKFREHGFVGSLPKPYAFSSLVILLRQLLGPALQESS